MCPLCSLWLLLPFVRYGIGFKPSDLTTHFPFFGKPGCLEGSPSQPPAMRPMANKRLPLEGK